MSKNLCFLFLCVCLCFISCDKQKKNTLKTSKTKTNFDDFFDVENFQGKYRPKISILGTFHYTNSATHDYIDPYAVDGLSEKRQQELKLLLEKLNSFKPTKILVERNRISFDSLINSKYHQYKNLDSVFNINDEVYLIAFPLAKRLNHSKIYASDANANWFGANLDWANFNEENYLKSKNQFQKSNRYRYEKAYQKQDSLKLILPLLEYYKASNTPKAQLFSHQIYLTETALSGAGDNYIGADAVARWYRRNLRIFANVLDLVEFDKEERILIIYGASHVWTLKQFFQDSPDFDYVEINSILK